MTMWTYPLTFSSRRNLLRAAFGFALGACALGSVPALAGDSDNFASSVLGLFGIDNGSPGIDYRERSPLVIPPSSQLPPPQTAPTDPNWPVEPEVRRARAQQAAGADGFNSSERMRESARPLPITEIERGRTKTPQHNGGSGNDISGPMSPSQLNTVKGGLLGQIFSKDKPDTARFTGEPSRASLTAPPTGYQTPSPNQPYGSGKDKYVPVAEDYYTTHGTNNVK